jgi:hypothetical protein
MSDTPNFDLNRPQEGKADWHVPLNSNFETLDGSLPIVDTYENRGNYSPTDGQPYLAHDLGLWLRYDANSSSWESIDKLGDPSKPKTADYSLRHNDVLAPPPSEGTAGIERVITRDNMCIQLWPGVYEGSLTISNDNIYIKGAGAQGGEPQANYGVTTIRANSDNSPIVFDNNFPTGGLVLDGICIDGNKQNHASGPAISLGIHSAHHRIKDCKIVNAETHAVSGVGIFNCQFINNQIHSPGVSGKFSSAFNIGGSRGNVSHILIADNDIRDIDGNCNAICAIRDGTVVRILNNEVGKVAGDFIQAGIDQSVQTLVVDNNYAELNGSGSAGGGGTFAVIGVNESVSELSMKNNFSYQGDGDGINLRDVSRGRVSNNRMAGFGGDSFVVGSRSDSIEVGQNSFPDGESINAEIIRQTRVVEKSNGQQELKLDDGSGRTVFLRAANGELVVEDSSGNVTRLS